MTKLTSKTRKVNMREIHFVHEGKVRVVHSFSTEEQLKIIRDKDGNLSEVDIELLARDIKLWADENRKAVGYDHCMLWNDKKYFYCYPRAGEGKWVHDYCELKKFYKYASEDCVFLFSVDGALYRIFNYNEHPVPKAKLDALLHAYGLMLDFSDYCFWEVVSENKY